MADAAVVVRDLGKRYRVRRDVSRWTALRHAVAPLRPVRDEATGFWALRAVTFELAPGDRLGIIGPNGAGKSTLLKILARIVYPTEGEARLRGRVVSLLEIGTGFNPNLSGKENVYLNALVHGLTRAEADARFDEIVAFSGVGEFLDLPVRHYSSGMFTRLAFAVAAHLEPDVLLLDEVLAVGDLSFQQKCLRRMEQLGSDGRTILFVSHSMEAIVRFCNRCLWLDHGRVVLDGPAGRVTQAYHDHSLGMRSRQYWSADASDESPKRPDGLVVGGADASVANGLVAARVTPPGNTLVRLVAARVVDVERRIVSSVRTDETVGIEVVYEILKGGRNIQPALHFRTGQDALAFVAAYTDPECMRAELPPGRYTATAWVPPHLLNTGVFRVTIQMVSPDPLDRHCAVDRALEFRVTDPMEVEGSARGLYGRDFPGAVRPLLRWETLRAGNATPAGLPDPPGMTQRPR